MVALCALALAGEPALPEAYPPSYLHIDGVRFGVLQAAYPAPAYDARAWPPRMRSAGWTVYQGDTPLRVKEVAAVLEDEEVLRKIRSANRHAAVVGILSAGLLVTGISFEAIQPANPLRELPSGRLAIVAGALGLTVPLATRGAHGQSGAYFTPPETQLQLDTLNHEVRPAPPSISVSEVQRYAYGNSRLHIDGMMIGFFGGIHPLPAYERKNWPPRGRSNGWAIYEGAEPLREREVATIFGDTALEERLRAENRRAGVAAAFAWTVFVGGTVAAVLVDDDRLVIPLAGMSMTGALTGSLIPFTTRLRHQHIGFHYSPPEASARIEDYNAELASEMGLEGVPW